MKLWDSKMWFLLVIIYPVAILGLQDSILLSTDYFRERKVPFVCVVDCGDDLYWAKEFAKLSANDFAVSRFSANLDNHQDMEQCFFQSTTSVGVVMKTNCEQAKDLLFTASGNMWFDSIHVWLLIEEKNNAATVYSNLTDFLINGERGKVLETMEQLNISVDADIKMAVQTDTLSYKILDLFNFGKVQGGALKVIDTGSWSFASGFTDNLNEYKYYKRWDFGQWPLRILSVATIPPHDFDPSILTSVLPVPGVSSITRTTTNILTVIAEVHNIRTSDTTRRRSRSLPVKGVPKKLTITTLNDNPFSVVMFVHSLADRWMGKFERNYTRTAVTSLYFGDQDLTSALRIATPLTYRVSFINLAMTSIETRYYYRIPTTGPGKYENQFLRPLSIGVWTSTVGMAVLCILILVATARLERRPSSVQYAMFTVIANICQQFFEDEAQIKRSSAAGKLTIFITGISCVLIYNYYTSSVVSWLLNGPPPSITSLQELLESPLQLIYQDIGYTRSWLSGPGSYYYNPRNMVVEDKIRRKIQNRKIESILRPLDEGIAMMKAGGYAFHMETDTANELISKTFLHSEICELGSLQSIEKTLLYPGVQKDSPYKEFLTWSLAGLLERGFVSCVRHRTTTRPVLCEGSSPRALALGGAAPAFIMLALGYIISTAIMLAERCMYRIKHKDHTFQKK